MFLKVCLADNISPLVNEGFAGSPDLLSAIDVWTLAFLFGFQIYFDFSAYSHIAVGSAKMMGINIPENFNFPYIASSFKNFWKRWHISLSSWIRDYLYLPLSGVQVIKSTGIGGIGEGLESTTRQAKTKALFFTWAIMGLWHGANWTFLVWGIYHAIIIYIERKLAPIRIKFPILNNSFIGWVITLPLAMLSWIPFRAQSLNDTMTMFAKVLFIKNYAYLTLRENDYIIVALLILIVTAMYFINTFLEVRIKKIWYFYFVVNCIKYAILIILVFTFLRPISQFIYFQF